jgi:hypothetical protein
MLVAAHGNPPLFTNPPHRSQDRSVIAGPGVEGSPLGADIDELAVFSNRAR